MNINISAGAAAWFKRELALQQGDYIRLFPRYSSGGGLHPGFSLGLAVEAPARPAVKILEDGITFYMEEQDLWYMDGHDLTIVYSENEDDIEYRYEAVSLSGSRLQ